MSSFWPTADHWSTRIPLATPHPRLAALDESGFVALSDADFEIPAEQYLALEYMDWKSGGDTNFAPIASADGQLDCRGFWDKGKTDKDAIWTSNADVVPGVRDYVESVGANFGRVRIIKLEPQTRDEAIRSIHRDDNNRFNPVDEGWVVRSWVELTDNPDSYMLLMDNGPDGLPDRDTEIRVPLHQGARFLVDTQRLWHVVVHTGNAASVCPDHQLRIGSDARALGRDTALTRSRRLIQRPEGIRGSARLVGRGGAILSPLLAWRLSTRRVDTEHRGGTAME